MPALGLSVAYGLVGGLIGGLVMAVLIMMMLGKRIKDAPPSIMAEKMFGDSEKRPVVLFPAMTMWGAAYGVVVSVTGTANFIIAGLAFALVPWLALNMMMLPMAGAGIFGLKRWGMIPVLSLVMHLIWGLVTSGIFSLLAGIIG